MSRYSKKPKPSTESKDEATRIAKATQRPGQTKEQTKLIAQGIQKGIDQYRKKHKAKARELDKRLREAQSKPDIISPIEPETRIVYRHHWLPWLLLLVSWAGFALFIFFGKHPWEN